MINPSLIESSTFFFQSKLLIYCIRFFLSSDQASIDLKKDKKYTKDVDVSNAPCCPTPTVHSPKNILVSMAATVLMSDQPPIGLLAVASAAIMGTSSLIGLFSDNHSYSFIT